MFSTDFTIEDYDFSRDLISIHDYVLAPVYFFIFLLIAYLYRNRKLKGSPLRKFFIPGLLAKLIGGITVCLIYNYYYGGGDTSAYFNDGKMLSTILVAKPADGLRLLFSNAGNIPNDLHHYILGFRFADAQNSFLIVKLSAIIQLFCFQSFLATSMMFGFLSFWGIWKIVVLFTSFYPDLKKEFAISFLFLPSIFFWGSGILKDTVCLTSLCLLFCAIYNLFIKRVNKVLNVLIILITSYIIITVKVYIIMSFIVCILVFVFLNYRSKLKSRALRNFIVPIFIFLGTFLAYLLTKAIGAYSESGLYSVENLLETARTTREYLLYVSDKSGSSYSLPQFDNSIVGFISIFPFAVNVTLFRPYIWEAHNVIAMFASLENLFILILTLHCIFKAGILNTFRIIVSHDLIFFCITFSLLFAFAIGISNSNFGTLVRYKIPCIPFYVSAIYLIRYIIQKEAQQKKLKKSLSRSNQLL